MSIQGPSSHPIQPNHFHQPSQPKSMDLSDAKAILEALKQDLQDDILANTALLTKSQVKSVIPKKSDDVKQRARLNAASVMGDNPDVEDSLKSQNTETIDAVRRKEKKSSHFDEKMEELASLEGQFDLDSLNEDEKGILSSFFSNIRKIKQLRKRKKELDEQEKKYKKLLDAQKDKKNGSS